MALTAAGVGSGIDIEGILSQLDEIERQPVEVLNQRRESLDVELSAYGTVKSSLRSFQDAARELGSNSEFGGFVASSSDEEVFTATASNGTAPVNVEVEVLALATNHRLSSPPFESATSAVDTGTLSFSSGENTFDVIVDNSNNTLEGLRDAINAVTSNNSVSASIVNVDGGARLVLTARESGTDGRISITGDSGVLPRDDDSGFSQISAATDASLVVHGFQVTRSSNTISDVISGVTLDLTGVGKSTVDSRRDLTTLKTAMDEFVTSYNAMSSSLTDLAQSELQGDQLPRGIESRMRATFFNTVEIAEDDIVSAFDMGLSFDRFGTLTLDTNSYEAALEKGVDRFVDVFSRADTGISSMFTNLVDEYTEAGGVIDAREDGVGTRQSSIDDQIERLEYRIEQTNDRLRRQFTAMDLAVTNLQSTSNFLSTRLG